MKLWRGQPDNWNWKPSDNEQVRVWLGIGTCFYLLALSDFLWPSQPRHTGRWGWLHAIFFGMFGSSGDMVLYSSVGTAFVLFGFLKFRALH